MSAWRGLLLLMLAGGPLAGCRTDLGAPIPAEVEPFFTSQKRPVPPFAMNAPSGAELRLTRLTARAVVEAPLAYTELELEFGNTLDGTPEHTHREASFRIALPARASLSRFAVQHGNGWREAEVLDKSRAIRLGEGFLQRRPAPALEPLLLEPAGDDFSVRFLSPPEGPKKLFVAYSEELSAQAPYRIALGGLGEIGTFEADVTVIANGTGHARLKRTAFRPGGDFTIPAAALGSAQGRRGGGRVVVRLSPGESLRPEPLPSTLVLVDTSGSRALGFEASLGKLLAVASELTQAGNGSVPLAVAAFDQRIELLYDGTVAGFGTEAVAKLRARRALGATDLTGALEWACKQAATRQLRRVVVFTDGVSTASGSTATEADDWSRAASALRQAGVTRLDIVVTLQDDPHRGKAEGLAAWGAVIPSWLAAPDLAKRLLLPVLPPAEVAIDGASWVYPKRLVGHQPGEDVLVVAELPDPQPLRIRVGGQEVAVSGIGAAHPSLLRRSWAKAKLENLLEQEHAAGVTPERTAEIVKVSRENRVVSPDVWMLLPEEDYHFHFEPLADILTIQHGELALLGRGSSVAAPAPRVPRHSKWTPQFDPLTPRMAPWLDEQAGFSTPGSMWGADFTADEGAETWWFGPAPKQPARALRSRKPTTALAEHAAPPPTEPWDGQFKEVMTRLSNHEVAQAYSLAETWQRKSPGDVLALVALGQASKAKGELSLAERAWGSIIDLYFFRPDLGRFAAAELESLGSSTADELALNSYRRAFRQQPPLPSSYHGFAMALVKRQRFEEAIGLLENALMTGVDLDRFPGADRILREDLGLVAAAELAASGESEALHRPRLEARLAKVGATVERAASLRFILTWETERDVELHLWDDAGGHAWFGKRALASGGELYGDATRGFGPECFAVSRQHGEKARRYTLLARYSKRGPMGFGMGRLQVIRHDGAGRLRFEEHPFVVTKDAADVTLGDISG